MLMKAAVCIVMGWAVAFCARAAGTADPSEAAEPQAPAAEDFARIPAVSDVELSPDGRHLALLLSADGGHVVAGVMDLDPLGKPRIVASFMDADVHDIDWVNNHRLIYTAYQRQHVLGRGGGGTFAVEQDGTGQRQLIAAISAQADMSNVSISSKLLPWGWSLRSTIDDGGDDVLVVKALVDGGGEPQGYDLVRLNTVTGNRASLSMGLPEHTYRFLLDANGAPRVLLTEHDGREEVWWRGKDDQPWQSVASFSWLDANGFMPWHIDTDGTVLVVARHGRDAAALYKFDPVKKRLDDEPFVSLPGFDLTDARAEEDSETHKLVAIHYETDTWHTYWLDPALDAIQKGVDKALPAGRVNRLMCGRCSSSRFIIVESSSDRQPGEFYLFDRAKGKLQFVAARRPWIHEAQQGSRTFRRVVARDGLELPVYVTSPPGAGSGRPLPTILLPHGGPNVRGGSLAWDAEAQFYATRGWRVLQPEYRGSVGYGWNLFHAGWRQWGKAMQDDLTDTVAWAVKQGLTDPGRVCIAGGSYGGYAALMGPVRSPGAYRCAVSFAGVTDLQLLYTATWSDESEEARKYGQPTLVGDPVKDAEMLAHDSPLHRVAEIKVPVLLMHGAADLRVPIDHERVFMSAARNAGVNIEEVIYPDEGHGFNVPEDRADYLKRVEAFVRKAFDAKP